MIPPILDRLDVVFAPARYRERKRAEYVRAFRCHAWIFDGLAFATQPHDRHLMLLGLADTTDTLADVHRAAFGRLRVPGEDGRDMTACFRLRAALYRALANVEEAVAHQLPRAPAEEPIETAAGPVLDEMATTPDLDGRAVLLEQLHKAVEPVAGRYASAVLFVLPAPGWIGWMPGNHRPLSLDPWYSAVPSAPEPAEPYDAAAVSLPRHSGETSRRTTNP